MTEHGLTNTKAMKRKKRSRLVLIICCIALFLVLLSLTVLLLLPKNQPEPTPQPMETTGPTVSTEPSTKATEQEPQIGENVSVSGVSLSGLTRQKAMERLSQQFPIPYPGKEVMILAGENQLSLTPEALGLSYDYEKALDAAMQAAETDIPLEVTVNTSLAMAAVREQLDVYIPSGYWVEGQAPTLDQETESSQSIVINKGAPGYLVDLQEVLDGILPSLESGTPISLDIQGDWREPQALDAEKIFNQYCTAPVPCRVNPDTLEILPGENGYGFHLETAKAMLEQALDGETIRLPMVVLEPKEEDAWFQDTLGYCKTPYTDNENRNENLRLACSKLNGLILQPGETLSYNELLGKRTTEAGYKPAPAYSGTELVDEVGGGICQVSSTLYLSALFAELHIVERRNHGYPASYIPLGLDATVNWGTTDLKLRNDYELPVKILAEASDGYVKVKIMGVERRDYYVKMEYRVDDHPDYAAAFLCRYDRETDEQIYRVLDHTSIYLEEVWCEPGYAVSDTDEP